MAKKSYIGIDGKARQIKKWYIGIDSKARKVKKAYIGIGGVARPFMSGEAEYYGTISELSVARDSLAGATVGNYALFAGGRTGSSSSASTLSTVDAYSSSLVRSTPTALSVSRNGLVGATVGNYALFAGGTTGSAVRSTVDAYVG